MDSVQVIHGEESMNANETARTTMSARQNEKREHTAFGLTDERGREIGALAVTFECDYITRDDEADKFRACFRIAPGHYFEAYVHATRNEKAFGASQRTMIFQTAAERDAYVTKRLENSRKAAAKKQAVSQLRPAFGCARDPLARTCWTLTPNPRAGCRI
jgi:hypothetical protein